MRPDVYGFLPGPANCRSLRGATGPPLPERIQQAPHLAARVRQGSARFVKGNDFIGDAFRAKGDEALAIFTRALKARIDQANRRK